MSESPVLECLPTCKNDCLAYSPPDLVFRDRILSDTPNSYEPLKLPANFSSFADYSVPKELVNLLRKILPNVPHEASISYLNTASIIWFLHRAHDGILKSNSNDLIQVFEDTLSGIGGKHLDMLDNSLAEIRKAELDKSSVETLANRTKAIFSLSMAIRVMEKDHNLRIRS